jgi:hypothetical protein
MRERDIIDTLVARGFSEQEVLDLFGRSRVSRLRNVAKPPKIEEDHEPEVDSGWPQVTHGTPELQAELYAGRCYTEMKFKRGTPIMAPAPPPTYVYSVSSMA